LIPIIAAGFFGIEHFSPPWDVIYLPLFNLLVLAYRFLLSDFALAIIVFTVVIRTVLAPLFAAQIRQQKEMQRMQPLIREVQRKHKGNPQKIQQEQQALYREHGVNPLGGCLPLLVQMPILFSLYQVLIRASNVVTLTTDQVKEAAFTQLKAALPGITQLGTSGNQVTFSTPVSGPCNLPQFDSGNFTHFLPLNCQLVDPLHRLVGRRRDHRQRAAIVAQGLRPQERRAFTDALLDDQHRLSDQDRVAAMAGFVQCSPARVGEDVQHLVIARQRVGGEGMNTPGARDYRQVLEQNRAEAAALLVIRHRERDLGFALGRAVVSRNRDDLIAQLRDEDHPIPIVDVRDVLELRGSRARNG